MVDCGRADFFVCLGGSVTDIYAPLLSAVNFAAVISDITSVASLVVAVLVAIRAVRFIYEVVGGGDQWEGSEAAEEGADLCGDTFIGQDGQAYSYDGEQWHDVGP